MKGFRLKLWKSSRVPNIKIDGDWWGELRDMKFQCGCIAADVGPELSNGCHEWFCGPDVYIYPEEVLGTNLWDFTQI